MENSLFGIAGPETKLRQDVDVVVVVVLSPTFGRLFKRLPLETCVGKTFINRIKLTLGLLLSLFCCNY